MAEPVQVVEYDPNWVSVFEMLRDFVTPALHDIVTTIEHVGSTSIPGLVAKPIIDMDIVVSSQDYVVVAVQRLGSLGYIHESDLGITGREAFAPPAGLPAHHLYVCTTDNAELHRHILFRDYLRNRPEEANPYGQVKVELAQRFYKDRESYTNGKSEFVNRLLERAGWKA